MIEFASVDDLTEIAELHVASIRATYPGIFPDDYFKKKAYRLRYRGM